MGLIGLMKKLKLAKRDSEKLWFFKIGNFLKNENLRLYSLPLDVIFKNLDKKSLLRLPDPRDFVIGLNYIRIESEANTNIKTRSSQSNTIFGANK